jgi:3-oxoadipate enol-lactonase
MPHFDLGPVSLYAERSGTGDALLFISGTGGDLRQKPSIFGGPLGPLFDIVAFDQRGLGQSSVPDGPYTMAEYADDAAGLAAKFGWDSCLVAGVSFGGMVAQELAIRHPHLARRLCLVCTSPGGEGGASIPFTELESLSGRARAERQMEMMDVRWNDERRATHAAEWNLMVDVLSSRDSAGDGDGDGDNAPEQARGAALQLEARSHHDTWDRLDQIACPTLICAGRYDGIAPPENSERMASRITGAELDLFEGGHQFLWQDRRAFGRIIDFLQGEEGQSVTSPMVP